MEINTMTKICTKCDIEKEITEFHNSCSRGRFGVKAVCKLCSKSPSARKKFLVSDGFKLCSKCDKEKPLSEFSKKSKGRFGVNSICKACISSKSKDYRKRTFKFQRDKIVKRDKIRRKTLPWVYILYGIRQRCANPKASGYKFYGERGIQCLISEEEVRFLWFRDEAHLLKKPSIHRINNDGNYCVENCRFIEQNQNKPEHTRAKPILQFTLDNKFIKEWKSLKEASLFYNIHSTAITQNLQERSKHCNGYIWKYKEIK
jgi:hypothetical protein